jgi:hypothetical protein
MTFARARPLEGERGVLDDDNTNAVNEPGEPLHAAVPGGASLWYAWRAPRTATFMFETTGSEIDTVLAVYEGDALAALSEVASNDDAQGSLQSLVRFAATAGVLYRIAVDGYAGKQGAIRLAWSMHDGPANDRLASAKELDPGGGSLVTDNTYASREAGEPAHPDAPGGRSLWFSWTPEATGTAIVTTAGSAFDTLLAVYTGATLGALALVAANRDWVDSTSVVRFAARRGERYSIVVDGYRGASGAVQLGWSLGTPPANGAFASPQVMEGSEGELTGNNTFSEPPEPDEPNHAGQHGGRSLWYTWRPGATGTAVIDTSGSDFDTLLAVYAGESLSTLREVISNDDESRGTMTSRVSFELDENTEYRVAVDGFAGAAGRVVLRWSIDERTRADALRRVFHS